MKHDLKIPEPFLFNPLKHYLPFIKNFIEKTTTDNNDPGSKNLIRELKHLGTCVMDIYTGYLPLDKLFK